MWEIAIFSCFFFFKYHINFPRTKLNSLCFTNTIALKFSHDTNKKFTLIHMKSHTGFLGQQQTMQRLANYHRKDMSRLMGKPTICICENKGADQLRGNREADQRLCFRYWIVQFLLYLTPKFQASSLLLCLYSSLCFRPVRKPHWWFSHEVAHMEMNREVHIC